MNIVFKYLMVGLLGVSAAYSGFAQGEINFFTYNANSTKGGVFYTGGVVPLDSGWYGQLWYSDVSATAAKQALSPVEAFNSSGVINLGNITDPVDDAGNFIWYDLVVWNVGAGNSATAALGANFPGTGTGLAPGLGLRDFLVTQTVRVLLGGVDAEDDPPFNVPQGNGFANAQLFDTPPPIVPEPSTILIGCFGAAALLAFRRCK